MDIKKVMICLSIVAILTLCLPTVAVATTDKYSTTFHNNARHTGDHIPMARGSTSNGTLNWNYVTEGILTSSDTPKGIVYVGSHDHNVYPLNADTGTKMWNYTTASVVYSSPTVANGFVYVGSDDHNVYASQRDNRDEGVELRDRKLGVFFPHRHQRIRLCGELGS